MHPQIIDSTLTRAGLQPNTCLFAASGCDGSLFQRDVPPWSSETTRLQDARVVLGLFENSFWKGVPGAGMGGDSSDGGKDNVLWRCLVSESIE